MSDKPQVMTAACTTYLMDIPRHSKREKIILQANKPGVIEGKRCDGDTVVEQIYAQWHQCDDQ